MTNTYTRDAQPVQFHAWWMHCILDRRVSLDISNALDFSADPTTYLRCTSTPAVALEIHHGKDPKPETVSQSLAVNFLGPSKAYVSPVVVIP